MHIILRSPVSLPPVIGKTGVQFLVHYTLNKDKKFNAKLVSLKLFLRQAKSKEWANHKQWFF